MGCHCRSPLNRVITVPPASCTARAPCGHVPHPGCAEYPVLHYAPADHGQLVGDAAGGAEFALLACQPAGETVGDAEVTWQADEAVGDGLLGFQHFDRLTWLLSLHCQPRDPGAAAPAAVQHEAAAVGRPRDVERRRHGAPAMDHADGRGEDRQAVEEVGGSVQRVQHPQRVPSRLLRLFLLLGGLLAQDAVAGEAAQNLGGQIRLGLLVGGGDRVALIVVLEFHLDPSPEVAGQYSPRAASNVHRVAFDLQYLRVVKGLHNITLTPALSLPSTSSGGEGESWGKRSAALADGQPASLCLNQDSQDLRIFKMEIPNPANPFILIILIILIQTIALPKDLWISGRRQMSRAGIIRRVDLI